MTSSKGHILTLNKAVPIAGSLYLLKLCNCPAFCDILQPSAQEIGNITLNM